MSAQDSSFDSEKLSKFVENCINSLFGKIGGSYINYEIMSTNKTKETAKIQTDALSISKLWQALSCQAIGLTEDGNSDYIYRFYILGI